MNTVGSVGSTLGVSFSFISHFILPITVCLISISVYTLRSKPWRIIIMGLIGGVIIITSSLLDIGFISLLIGNALLITASIIGTQEKSKKSKKKSANIKEF